MILPALYELYERLNRDPEYEICPPGFSLQKLYSGSFFNLTAGCMPSPTLALKTNEEICIPGS